MSSHPPAASASEENVFLTQGNEVGVDPHLHSATHDDFIGSSGVDSSDVIGVHDHVSQSTRLHHKMREMKEMDDALALMKSDYIDRQRAVKEGEAKFLIKQHNIIKYLRRFKLFILESDTKRARAEKKEAEEHRQRLLKIKEIEALRAQFLELQQRRSDLKQKNDHYKQNKQYLESVKDAVPEQYAEIDELIVRYQILKQTNTDLTEANRLVNDKMESISQDLQHLLKSSQNTILVKNSRFASLLQKLEQVTNATSGVETEVQNEEKKTKDMNRYFGEIQMAIQNIYSRTMASLPSAKAVIQMKKRLQAQNSSSQSSTTKQQQQNGNNTNGRTSPDGMEDTTNASSSNSTLARNAHSSGTSSAQAHLDDLLDDSDDDLDGDGNTNADQSSNAATTSAADDAAQRLALQQHNRAVAAKQQSVKAHLLSRLDAIAERLEDLQDIVEYIHPGALQLLREGGSIYQAPNFNLLQSGGGGMNSGYSANVTGSGPSGMGGGSSGGMNTDRNRSSRRTNQQQQQQQSQQSQFPPSSTSTLSPNHTSLNQRSKPSTSNTSYNTSQQPSLRRNHDEPNDPSASPSREYKGEHRVEMEKKFRTINSTLAASMHGLLGDKSIPAHQQFVPRSISPSKGFPPVKGSDRRGGASSSTMRSTPRTTQPTPRSPGRG